MTNELAELGAAFTRRVPSLFDWASGLQLGKPR